jgi:hypothetical protein
MILPRGRTPSAGATTHLATVRASQRLSGGPSTTAIHVAVFSGRAEQPAMSLGAGHFARSATAHRAVRRTFAVHVTEGAHHGRAPFLGELAGHVAMRVADGVATNGARTQRRAIRGTVDRTAHVPLRASKRAVTGALPAFVVTRPTDGAKTHPFVRGVLTRLRARANKADGKHQQDSVQNSARGTALRTTPTLGLPGERQRGERCTHSRKPTWSS